MRDEDLMRRAIALSREQLRTGAGGPFGAVVARAGEIVAEGVNRVTSTNDPTAHAEIIAIRAACRALGTFTLAGCAIYTSCEPCPMCLAAIYWARLDRLCFANGRADAAAIGFDDARIDAVLARPRAARAIPAVRVLADEARDVFAAWTAKTDKIRY
ncbi:MAG: nucleoside deaminase [Deltaproteobacteria bacterium]|nr:nucleoside deaminase [Deltaproteobacteria bacterium]